MKQLELWYERIEIFHRNCCENVRSWPASSLPIRKGILESQWLKAQNIHEALLLDYGHDNGIMALLEDVQERAILMYGDANKEIDTRVAELKRLDPTGRKIRASEISAVDFNGSYADWPAWRAQFFAKVYDTGLETHEKIELLAKSLAGEAAACVGPIINRDEQELERAWSMLTKRYDNEYQLTLAHMNEILNIQAPSSDTAKGLRKIVDTINQQLRMLERFGFATESWAPLIISIILRKLDQDTYKEWEKLESRRTMPALEEMMAFLERRIASLSNWRDSHPSQKDEKGDNRHRPYDKAEGKNRRDRRDNANGSSHRSDGNQKDKPAQNSSSVKREERDPCLACAGSHRLWNCRKFRGKSLEEMIAEIEQWNPHEKIRETFPS